LRRLKNLLIACMSPWPSGILRAMRRRTSWFMVALTAGALWSTALASAQGKTRVVAAATKSIDSVDKSESFLPAAKQLAKTQPPQWVTKKPPRSTQTQKSARARGINPCLTPDPGFGNYGFWDRSPSMGQMIVPEDLRLGRRGEFDVVFHFHGHEAARKEWVQSLDSGVLVGIDLGTGSGPYLKSFSVPGRFQRLLESVEAAIAERAGVPKARARRIGLTAWSAGYGAVESILRTELGRRKIDSVVLLDGLHTGYENGIVSRIKLEPFADFARRAARGETLMFVSHSSIIPPSYASTTETANYLIWQVGGAPLRARPRQSDPMGLELLSRYTRGGFHVRGFSGNDTLDHCAQIGLYRDVLRHHIAPRWNLKTRPDGQIVASR
jgi:hypothetical protein